MNETREILEGQDNEAGQGATNVHEDKGKPSLPPSEGNTSKKGSIVWGYFTIIEVGGGDLGQLVTTVVQPMLVTLNVMALQT